MFKILFLLMLSLPVFASNAVLDCEKNTEDELTCAACNIYHESRGEGAEGMEAIAWVMLNRKFDDRFPDNVCSIVWDQPYGRPEFAWTDDGKSDKITDQVSWDRSVSIAHELVIDVPEDADMSDDPTMGAIFYRTVMSGYSKWWDTLLVTNDIGKHRFYVDGE